MVHMEILVDNEDRTITFDTETYDIGVPLLLFIQIDLDNTDNEHPYIKYFQSNKNTLAKLQARYKEAVIDCLLIKPFQQDKKIERSTRGRPAIELNRTMIVPPITRLYNSDFNTIKDTVTMQYRAGVGTDGANRFYEAYRVSSVSAVCYIEFMKLIQFGLSVRMCQNCGLFFVPKGDYDTKYCDRIPKGETKRTCQQIGAVNAFKAKVAENPLLTEYNKIYRRFHSRKRNGIITPAQFDAWKKHAVAVRDKAVRDDLTVVQFIEKMDGISI